jgi:hypothetical protein
MDGERFYEVRARLGTLDEAVRVARTLDASGVAYVAVDNGEGYGLRECTAEGCSAALAYPDEGTACDEHTCAECGGVSRRLADNMGYACDTCYGGRWDK